MVFLVHVLYSLYYQIRPLNLPEHLIQTNKVGGINKGLHWGCCRFDTSKCPACYPANIPQHIPPHTTGLCSATVPQAEHNQTLSHTRTQVCHLPDNSTAFQTACSLQDTTEESQGREKAGDSSKLSEKNSYRGYSTQTFLCVLD